MGWKRLLVIIFFFPMVMTCQKMRHGKNMFTGAPRRASVSSVWSLWSTAECGEGKEQAVKGRAQEPPALMCSVGWAEDGGQIPVLICKELCTCVVHGSVYCGMGGSSFHLIHLAETEHKLSCLGSSCYRPDFFFFSKTWKCTSTAQENHFPPSSPHEMKAVTLRILLFVDFGTQWNNYHRSKVNMFLRLFFFISLGIMGFPLNWQETSSFTCVCAEKL